jgi:hypothetical protein
MDALFFSQRPEDHVELARAVARLDPQAFASLARAMSTLATSAPSKKQEGSTSSRPAPGPDDSNPSAATKASDSRPTNVNPALNASAGLTAAQSDFFHATNAAAVQGVMEAIETQVDRLLRKELQNRRAIEWRAKFIANWMRRCRGIARSDNRCAMPFVRARWMTRIGEPSSRWSPAVRARRCRELRSAR